MKILHQIRTANGQIFPSPRPDEIMYETPPAFCWLKEEGVSSYRITVRNEAGLTVWQGETDRNFIVPDTLLAPGIYEWNLCGEDAERGWQKFTISEEAVEFIRPDAKAIFEAAPTVRPRHLFFEEDIPSILKTHTAALDTLRRNIALAIEEGIPEPPRYHKDENALPYREYFGRHRDFCDRNLIACALGHRLLKDEAAAKHAKELLLALCDWNSEGPCSLESIWGDEIGLSHARCLPAAFDLCYDLLDEKQRVFVARVVALYAAQCERLLSRIDFCQNPGNSHAGRQPAYLGEAALVLKGTGVVPEETLIRWLTFAIDVYGGIFPYFGGPDGSWAEGMFYASSYTKWFLPFFSAVNRFAGVDFLKRPFYQRYVRYLQHFCPPGWEVHPFGDGYWCKPENAEWPGFFAQDPLGVYARRFGSELAKKRQKDTPTPELYLLHLLDTFLPVPKESVTAEPEDNMALFPEAGFAAMHTDLADGENDFACLIHATKFGSGSHRHADQGSFALFCGKTALISPSGYFGREYGTAHHMQWTNATKAHNCVLIDGAGQGIRDFTAAGKITGWGKKWNLQWVEADLSAAYPMLKSYTRKYRLFSRTLIVEDRIEAEAPVTVDYLLHALSKPGADGSIAWVERNGKKLRITPVLGDLGPCAVSDEYDTPLNEGVPEGFHASMPPQFHMKWQTAAKTRHCIVMRYDLL